MARKHETQLPSPEYLAELVEIAIRKKELEEIKRLYEATLERTRNWREELVAVS